MKFIEQTKGNKTDKGPTAVILWRALMYCMDQTVTVSLLEENQFKTWMYQFDLFKDENGV